MKFRIIAALVLALLLALLLFMARNMDVQYESKLEKYETESAQLTQMEERVTALEAQVQQLLQRQAEHEAEAERLTSQAQQAKTRQAELEEEKQALLEEIRQIEGELAALRDSQDENSDEAYYLEVYDALTKGLEAVKGYLSDH